MSKGFIRKFKPFEILSEEQIEVIRRAIFDVLWETGLRIEHKRALKIFEENGCKVNYGKMRVKFPPSLVEECLRKCPSTFRVKARDSKNDLIMSENTLYFGNMPGMRTVDIDTWEPRLATRKENYDAVKVLDALDSLHYLSPYSPYFGFEGVPPVMAIPESVAGKLRNSSKPLESGYAQDCEVFAIKMAKAVGSEIMVQCLSSPPLTYYSDAIESVFRSVEAGFPFRASGGCVYGSTSPATIAGSVVVDTAELIGPIVLAQLLKLGTRIYTSDFTFPQNMRTGAPKFGAIGCSLHGVISHQIWRRFGILCASGNTISSSKSIDFQNGYERTIACLAASISGANIIAFQGGVSSELTHHPLMSILDDDIAGMIGRFLEGVELSDETLALDLINKVGPIPGYYLDKKHTRKWWKREQFVPKAVDGLTYPEWMKTGKRSALDYAKERLDEILATHEPKPLTENQEDAIENILEEARNHFKQKSLISDQEMAKYRKSIKSPNYPYE